MPFGALRESHLPCLSSISLYLLMSVSLPKNKNISRLQRSRRHHLWPSIRARNSQLDPRSERSDPTDRNSPVIQDVTGRMELQYKLLVARVRLQTSGQ